MKKRITPSLPDLWDSLLWWHILFHCQQPLAPHMQNWSTMEGKGRKLLGANGPQEGIVGNQTFYCSSLTNKNEFPSDTLDRSQTSLEVSELCRRGAANWCPGQVKCYSQRRGGPWRALGPLHTLLKEPLCFQGKCWRSWHFDACWLKKDAYIKCKTSVEPSDCLLYCWPQEQQRHLLWPQLMAATQTHRQTGDTYPNMFEMESSSPPGGGWEIFLLLKTEKAYI